MSTDYTPIGPVPSGIANGTVDATSRQLARDMRGKAYGKDVRETIARMTEWHSIRSSASEVLAAQSAASAQVSEASAKQSAQEVTQNAQNAINLLNDAIGQQVQKIDNMVVDLTDKDINSAPEIIAARRGKPSLGAKIDEVTTQLAQTVKKGETGTLNLNVFDEPTRNILQGQEPGTINSVLGAENVINENLKDDAVSYNKQRMLSFKKSDNLFNGNYGNLWAQTDGSSRLYSGNNLRSAVVDIKDKDVIEIITVGSHNRFTAVFFNENGDGYYEELVENMGTVDGNQKLIVQNKQNYDYLLVGVSNNGIVPDEFIVRELSAVLEFEQEVEVFIEKPNSNRYINPDTNAWVTLASPVSVIHKINKFSTIKIKTFGEHNRFAVYGLNKELRGGSFLMNPATKIYSTNENEHSEGNEYFSFVNTEYEFVYVLVKNASSEFSPSIRLSQSFTFEEKEKNSSSVLTPTVSTGITKEKESYPVLFGVKMDNSLNDDVPRPMGWLYYTQETPHEILYADGKPENMKHLFYWDIGKTWDGTKDPSWYRPHITKDGDVIFVYRGDRHGLGTTDPNSRQNPIIYPSGDWNNPIEIDFGTRLKPTSWLQNSGVEHLSNNDFFLFAEYTRPHHNTCNTWKVTKPYTNPDNWKVVQSFELSGTNQTGMKHLHQVDYDPFSGSIFTSTGDDDEAAKVFRSDDNGETWNVVLEGQRKYARVLNFIFTKEKVYWANDDSAHGFYSVDRDENGIPDFDNITTLFDLTGHPPTYVNALVDDPHGILILHRHDGTSEGPLIVHFWDIENESMHEIKEIKPLENETTEWGFRVEAVNFYQSRGSNETVVGFSSPRNKMDLLNNNVNNRINNMVLKVVEKGDSYDLEITAVR